MPRPLFEVPGWSVPTEPASSSPSKKSKKRKRPHDNDAPSEKLESAQVNLEKLMDALDPVKRPPKKKHKGKKPTDSAEGVADNKPTAATPPKVSPEKPKDLRKPAKKPKGTPREKGVPKPHRSPEVAGSEGPNLTILQNRMRKKLDGARFR